MSVSESKWGRWALLSCSQIVERVGIECFLLRLSNGYAIGGVLR